MNKKVENKKVKHLADVLATLNQNEIERISAKPKNSKKSAAEINSVLPHTKRFPSPLKLNIYTKHTIFNFYSNLLQTIRTTLFFHIITTSFIRHIMIRIIYFFLFILCNIIMIKHYVLLMKHYSAFYATVLNFSLNFFLSALCGIIFFHEKRKLLWFFGVMLIICGLIFILKDTINEEKIKNK
ncbi:hypothetical protein PFHG_02991 [Plasmodium falciparum HB3]|uniref:EamA domain-containing protein n=2 Tax=Plasmodium falciparum TaxID=5833 RepID=A0A0L7LY77_PLAF4|nr:hypothetical protein PFHG_02991 [Plasmodium falciparum HB3]KOB85557.1 hypothetical protein PFDG_01004 [Plasmodium falciparum Dd2]